MLATPFEITVIPVTKSDSVASKLREILSELRLEYPLCDTNETMRLVVDTVCSEDELLGRIVEIFSRSGADTIIAVGDAFVDDDPSGNPRATELTHRLRALTVQEEYVRAGDLCGVIGLVHSRPSRTRDVDAVVADGESRSLEAALCRTGNGLWLKSKHSPSQPADNDEDNRRAIQIHVVENEHQMQDYLSLRHRVYNWLGYLDDDLGNAKSAVDIDPFDKTSIHFAATDVRSGDVIGTMRLVMSSVPRMLHESTIGNPYNVWKTQKQWCENIARRSIDSVIRERLRSNLCLPLPILQNSNFGDRWPEFLSENKVAAGGEISRLVVSPRYQGLGISSLLLRAGIATACDLKKDFVLLECIPAHALMYSKAGFTALTGHHCRAQGLDQVAVGMRLDLTDSPYNVPVQLAHRDVETMRRSMAAAMTPEPGIASTEALCLCDLRRCWKHGHYRLRGEESCPLTRQHGCG